MKSMEHWWNDTDGTTEILGKKTCHSANLSTTDFTWADRGSNPGLRDERLTTNSLIHGASN